MRSRWIGADRNARASRAKKKPAAELQAIKEEHQCSGTGSHTGHRYVHMLTPRVQAQHRESTGVCEAAIKPGDFDVMKKSCPKAFKVDRSGS